MSQPTVSRLKKVFWAVVTLNLAACVGHGMSPIAGGYTSPSARAYAIPIKSLSVIQAAYEARRQQSGAEAAQSSSLLLSMRSNCSLQNNAYALAGALSEGFSTAITKDEAGWYWVVTATAAIQEAAQGHVQQWVERVAHTARLQGCWLSEWELIESSSDEIYRSGSFE